MDLPQLVESAENYWTAHTGYLPRFPRIEENTYDYGPPVPIPQNRPKQILQRPAPVSSPAPPSAPIRKETQPTSYEPDWEDLITRFNKMEAHLISSPRAYDPSRRNQYFGNN